MTKDLSQDSLRPGRDSNRALPEFKSLTFHRKMMTSAISIAHISTAFT
jgi:hypothetical protein